MNSENVTPVVRTGAGPDAQRVSDSQGAGDRRRRGPARPRRPRSPDVPPPEAEAVSASLMSGATDEDGPEPTHVDVRA